MLLAPVGPTQPKWPPSSILDQQRAETPTDPAALGAMLRAAGVGQTLTLYRRVGGRIENQPIAPVMFVAARSRVDAAKATSAAPT